MKKRISPLLKLIFLAPFLLMLIIFGSDYFVRNFSSEYCFQNINKLPKNKVGIVLGTSKFRPNGNINLFYKNRIDATVKLFKNHKIDFVLISGDNAQKEYNEPETFKADLIKRGIPEEKIFLDYAGFRTLDSIIRANKVFGQQKFTVISQRFHNERAIFIGRKLGLEPIGYNAKDVGNYSGFKINLREKLARVKTILDIYIINTKPKFLGERIIIAKK